MKADIKLCASSFGVVNLPILLTWSKSSSRCVHAALDSYLPVLLQLKRYFPWGRKWIPFCDRQSWNPTPAFNANFIICTRIKEHRFMDQWCGGTSVWKRQEVSSDITDHHAGRYPRTMSNEYAKHHMGALAVCSPIKFATVPTAPKCSWNFVQKTEPACLQVPVYPKDNTQRSLIKTSL
jgi:hypothetical protein